MTLSIVEMTGPTTQTGVPRDGHDRPLIVPRSGGKPKAHTRISSFADCLEDKSGLARYQQRMVLAGTVIEPGLREAAAGLDPVGEMDDKRRLNALAERAMKAAGSEAKANKGTYLHALSELVDAGEPLPDSASSADAMDMAAYKVATLGFDVLAIEQFVVVEELAAAGTLDRLVAYSGIGPHDKLFQGGLVADLKTGSIEFGGLKMACQIAAYSRGWVYDWAKFPVDTHDAKAFTKWKKTVVSAEEAEAAYSPLPQVDQDWGVVINLPAGSGEASLHWVDLSLGWEAAQEALRIRALRSKSSKALRPFAA